VFGEGFAIPKFIQDVLDELDKLGKTMKKKIKGDVKDDVVGGAGDIGEEAGAAFGAQFSKGFATAAEEFIAEAQDAATIGAEFFNTTFSAAEDQILEFLETGKFSFRELADVFLREMQRIIIKDVLSNVLQGLGIDSKGPGTTGKSGEENTGGIIQSVVGGIGSLFGGGGAAGTGQSAALSTEQGTAAAIKPLVAGTDLISESVQGMDLTVAAGNLGIQEGNATNKSGFSGMIAGLGTLIGVTSASGASGGGDGGGGGGFAGTLGAGIGAIGSLVSLGFAIADRVNAGGLAGAASNSKALVPLSVFKNAQRFQGGGIARGGIPGLDSIPALLTPGERVLSPAQTRAFDAGGPRSPVMVNFNFPEGTDATSFLEAEDQIAATTAARLDRAAGRNS